MAKINLQCNNLSQTHSNVFLRPENIMTGRAYLGEVLNQVRLRNE